MGYINYKLLYEKSLSDADFHILQKIFQKEDILLEPFKDHFKQFKDLGLIQYLKGKENTIEGIRISKKGKEFITQLETMGYNDSIGMLVDKLIELYNTNNKHTGNKLEIQNRLIWFIAQTGFSSAVLFNSVEEYLLYNSEYTKSLENLIWTPSSKAFSIHKNLKDSKLYDFICTKYNLNASFFVEDKKGKEIQWLADIANLSVPKNLESENYFTGSYEGDIQHVQELKNKYTKHVTIEK